MLQQQHMQISYMLHKTYMIHARKSHFLKSQTALYIMACSCSWKWEGELSQLVRLHHEQISYMLHKTYTIHARQSHLHKTHTPPYTFLHFLALRHEKESYRTICQSTPTHLSYMLHNTYTIHTRKFDSRWCVGLLWPFIFIIVARRRRVIEHFTATPWAHIIYATLMS